MELWFARHGESEWNARGLWQGQADPPLTPRGRAQAEALARTLGALAERPAAVVASDLARARETAEILAQRLALPLRLEPGLRERHVGAWSGLTHAEIGRRFAGDLARLREGDPEVRPGGGESAREFAARVGAALGGLGPLAGGRAILLVSHLGVLRVLAPGARLENAAWLRLGTDPTAPPAYAGYVPSPGGGDEAL